MKIYKLAAFAMLWFGTACQQNKQSSQSNQNELKPMVVTEAVPNDSDDPAIWLNKNNLLGSLVIGTDKDSLGGLYAFDLDGKIVRKSIPLGRPNNVDIGYGLVVNGDTIDFAVTGERHTEKLRIFSVPQLAPIDGGGVPVFEGETAPEHRAIMGVATYSDSGKHYVVVSRKTGPTNGTYLWQYELKVSQKGIVGAELIRKFGNFSGKKEIEALAIDRELGYIYCSDEQVGIRKYLVSPWADGKELALFGTEGFAADHEGLSICSTTHGKGYIIASDQGANSFRFFTREGFGNNPHDHRYVGSVKVAATSSDGSELTRETFNGRFPGGLFVAMSDDKTFHYYSLDSLIHYATKRVHKEEE